MCILKLNYQPTTAMHVHQGDDSAHTPGRAALPPALKRQRPDALDAAQ